MACPKNAELLLPCQLPAVALYVSVTVPPTPLQPEELEMAAKRVLGIVTPQQGVVTPPPEQQEQLTVKVFGIRRQPLVRRW